MKTKIVSILILISAIFLIIGKTRTNFDEVQKPFIFPQDHGLHYVIGEWLYFTGVVNTDTGKKIGYEMTIFQIGDLRWYLFDYVYAGHVAVSDVEHEKHYIGETISPVYLTTVEPLKPEVNIKNFSYNYSDAEGFAISANSGGIQLDFKCTPTREMLMHGEDGVILMGDDKESAYYSFTNLETTGTITYNGKTHKVVSGRTWMDHQWGNAKRPGFHWDWFSMRFEDGGSLMLFNIRDPKNNPRRIEWTYRNADGKITYGTQAEIKTARVWRDEPGKATYPMDWSIKINKLDAEFFVSPLFDAQSIHDVKTPSYWEGLCSVKGTIAGKEIKGDNYTEMTFYND